MMAKRQIVIYSHDAEGPGDLTVGEVLPVVRGDGPREGVLMGVATVTTKTADKLEFELNPAEKFRGFPDRVPFVVDNWKPASDEEAS